MDCFPSVTVSDVPGPPGYPPWLEIPHVHTELVALGGPRAGLELAC